MIVMPSAAAAQWLTTTATASPDGRYHHFHLVEDSIAWDGVRNDCEAKCTGAHDAALIANAHTNVTSAAVADIPRIIEILLSRGDTDALAWVDSLRSLHLALASNQSPTFTRHDLVCYVHSQAPVQRATWIPSAAPHSDYTAQRVLNAVELRLANVLNHIGVVYAVEVWT
jgi:hypothetical protein